jgi:outer membrane protein TolC
MATSTILALRERAGMANGSRVGEPDELGERVSPRDRSSCSWPLRLALLVSTLAATLGRQAPARALQPLEIFLARASETNPDNRLSQATQTQRDAEADRATAALLPTFQAQGTYTRNQYEVSFPASLFSLGNTGVITILPQNQLDAAITLSVPIVDVGAWHRRTAAKATRDAARADVVSAKSDVSRRVAHAYFQLLANEAVLLSARRNLELSQQNTALALAKREGGTASDLDIQRAKGDVASAEQQLATAALNVATGRRSLESLSGVTPEAASEFPADDLHEERPLDEWLGSIEHLPLIESAMASRRSAEAGASAADAGWLPSLTASAQERLTNAPSLTLHNEYYLLQLTATWKLDATVSANIRVQRAVTLAAIARADKTRRDAEDAIFDDWNQVHASVDIARAARAQVVAARVAADLARDRYQGGIATQLDVLQAKQDLFRADVARIQADADLGLGRASLRLDAARSIGDTRP